MYTQSINNKKYSQRNLLLICRHEATTRLVTVFIVVHITTPIEITPIQAGILSINLHNSSSRNFELFIRTIQNETIRIKFTLSFDIICSFITFYFSYKFTFSKVRVTICDGKPCETTDIHLYSPHFYIL